MIKQTPRIGALVSKGETQADHTEKERQEIEGSLKCGEMDRAEGEQVKHPKAAIIS